MDKTKQTIDQVEKTQLIRKVDVGLIGPAMMIAAANKHLHPVLRIILGVSGFATVLYNGNNLYINYTLKREAEKRLANK